MAKRELSGTLKNLKFMQRANVQKEEKPEEEEVKMKSDISFGSSTALSRKCTVIMEGSPHPGVKGRMSFQSFNPSIDKLNLEAANSHKLQACISSTENQIGRTSDRDDEISSEGVNITSPNYDSDIDLKRKQTEMETDTPSPHKSQRDVNGQGDGQSSSQKNRKGSNKQRKRERLDWNVLRPPKAQARRS